jgi:hypothetical protein
MQWRYPHGTTGAQKSVFQTMNEESKQPKEDRKLKAQRLQEG